MLLRQVVKKSAFAENVDSNFNRTRIQSAFSPLLGFQLSLCGHGFQVTGGENFVVPNVTNRQSLVRAPRAISHFQATHSEQMLTCEINCGGAHG